MSLSNTRKNAREIEAALTGVERIWFIGIGGIHMASLALLATGRGYAVAGSDRCENEQTARLRAAGISVFIGHDAAHMTGAGAVVYTLAIAADNPEYCAAREQGLPLFSRADFLGFLMGAYPRRVGVAGSHGKSTVTAWVGEMLDRAERSPTVVCGAAMRRFGGPLAVGDGADFVFEACEYEDSFLSFRPTLAVLLNVGWDHVDYFPDAAAAAASFGRFAALPGGEGCVLVNVDDPIAMAQTEGLAGRRYTFGRSEHADYRGVGVRFCGGMAEFTLVTPQGSVEGIRLSVPGGHNVYNALAAAGAGALCGLSSEEIAAGLIAFRGAARRMEYRGRLRGARVFDDYAHHPAEIAASIAAAREMLGGGGRLFALFQSHTYSRTAAFFAEICGALRGADRIYIADIYAARERETLGMSGEALAAGVGERASYVGGLSSIAASLLRELAPGDLLLVMGAGDIHRIFGEFSQKDFTL